MSRSYRKPVVKTEKKTISKKWKQALQKYCDLCEGGNMELPCVNAILKLAKRKGLKINDKDYNFEKLLEEL